MKCIMILHICVLSCRNMTFKINQKHILGKYCDCGFSVEKAEVGEMYS